MTDAGATLAAFPITREWPPQRPDRSLKPNSKIPAIIDPRGPNGRPPGLLESGAILRA